METPYHFLYAPEMAFTDIIKEGWIQRLPKPMRPYALLMRLDRPIGWWLLLLPAWISILMNSQTITAHTLWMMGLFWIGAIIMRGAGCIINDLWDRDLDKHVERTANRPIASGQISIEDALIFLLILTLIGLIILIQMPLISIFIGLCSIPFIIAYPLMKRITWWPQAFLGITFNFGALIGGAAITQNITLTSILLYLSGFLWTIAYDTIYAHQDKQDDEKVGIKSTARLFGEKSVTYVQIFYCSAFAFLLAAGLSASLSLPTYIFIMGSAFYAWIKIKNWSNDPDNQDLSLKTFQANEDIGLMIVLCLALGGLF